MTSPDQVPPPDGEQDPFIHAEADIIGGAISEEATAIEGISMATTAQEAETEPIGIKEYLEEPDVAEIYTAPRDTSFKKGVADKTMNFTLNIAGQRHFRWMTARDFAQSPLFHKVLLSVGQSEYLELKGQPQTEYVSRLINKGYSEDTQLSPQDVKAVLNHAKLHGYLKKRSGSALTLKAHEELELAKKGKSTIQDQKKRRGRPI